MNTTITKGLDLIWVGHKDTERHGERRNTSHSFIHWFKGFPTTGNLAGLSPTHHPQRPLQQMLLQKHNMFIIYMKWCLTAHVNSKHLSQALLECGRQESKGLKQLMVNEPLSLSKWKMQPWACYGAGWEVSFMPCSRPTVDDMTALVLFQKQTAISVIILQRYLLHHTATLPKACC